MTSSDDEVLSDESESDNDDWDLSNSDEDDFKKPPSKKQAPKPKPAAKQRAPPKSKPTVNAPGSTHPAPVKLPHAEVPTQVAASKPSPGTIAKSAKPIAQGTAVKPPQCKTDAAFPTKPPSNFLPTGIPAHDVTTQDQAQAAVLRYLEAQNQPFNAQLVTDNMRGRIRKPLVERALAQLALEQSIVEKVYGKSKLYWASQDRFDDVPPSEIDKMKKQLATLQTEEAAVQSRVREVKRSLEAAGKELSNEELDSELARYEPQVAAKQARLNHLKTAAVVVTADMIERTQKEYKSLRTQWRKRKRIVKDALETVTYENPKFPTPAKMAEEMGIETDEDWNVIIGQDIV